MSQYSGLLFDLAFLVLLAIITGGVMLYAKWRHALAFKNRLSQRRYNYETVAKQKDEELDRNTWF